MVKRAHHLLYSNKRKEYVLRNFTLQSLFNEVWILHVGLSSITYDHIFKERNLLEDALSKEGLGLAHGEWVVLENEDELHSKFSHDTFILGFLNVYNWRNCSNSIFCDIYK
jgi:hypothetical protein